MPDTAQHKPPSSLGSHGNPTITAWDLPTRAFHWLLVALVAAAWASFEFSENFGDAVLKWHRWIGLTILTLLVWRILWGFFGASTSRFSNFVPGPATLLGYAADIRRGREDKYLGHNPLGGLMIVALLGLLVTQASLGLFTVEHNDLTAGPLHLFLSEAGRKTATNWHRFLFEGITLWLIGIHIAANVAYALGRDEPLIKAMITGRKPSARYRDGDKAVTAGRPLLRAGILLIVAAAIVFGGIWAVGGKFLAMRLW